MTIAIETPRPGRTYTFLLLAIAALALALRAWDLGGESIWIDEGFSVRVSRMALPDLFRATSFDIHPPLYYVLLHFWMRAFGSTEAAVRSLSTLWGVLGVLAVARLGRQLFGSTVALAAAFLLALSPFHVHYSQEARGYAQNLLFSTLSLMAFLSWLRHGGTWRGALYVVTTALMVYTHSYGWLAVLGHNLVVLLPYFRPLRPRTPSLLVWLVSQLALLVLFLPWLAVLAKQLHTVKISFYAGAPTWFTLGGTFIGYAGSRWLLGLSALALLGWLIREAWGRSPVQTPESMVRRRAMALLALWLLLIVFVPFAISNLWFPTYIRRATMGVLPAWYLLVAAAITSWPRAARIGFLATIALLSALELGGYYREVNKERWRELAHEIETQARPGELVLFNTWYPKRDAYDYYARRTDLELLPFPELGQPWGTDPEARLLRLVSGRDRVWVVFSHTSDADGVILRTLRSHYREAWHHPYVNLSLDRAREREFPGIDAYRFER